MFGLFGYSPENLSQGFRRADIQVDPDIEDPVEFSGLANPEFDSYAAAEQFRIAQPGVGAFEFEDSPRARFKFRNRIPQFLGEGDPVGGRARKLSAHVVNSKSSIGWAPSMACGIPVALRIVAVIIAGVTGLSRGSAPIRSELP